ncbi:MAG TPA: VOC family protein [Ilumatobacteraceae bacterium]|jgi:predicted enzyme related to lactoylglutathione lyase
MTSGMKTILYPVKDLAAAKQLYGALLGTEPVMDQPYYVGYNVDGQDVGLDPNGHSRGLDGPLGYWHVDDIASTISAVLAAGGEKHHDVTDVGGGKLVAAVKDADGNVIGLLQP